MSNLDEKKVQVDALKQIAEQAFSAIAVDYRGTDVPKLTNFRRDAKGQSVHVKIIKNTLAKKSFRRYKI